jgi:hypothetical protein
VLFATYLYTKPDRVPSQPAIRYAELEQTVSPPAREYGDPFASLGKSSPRANGVNDSTPAASTEDVGSHSKREA